MYKRESFAGDYPPTLKSPPPMSSPHESNRSYRWTSMTAANNSRFADSPQNSERKKPDVSWLSPSRGDTWRRNAPRGRTLHLAAAFDQCARQEQLESPKYVMPGRFRRNSEPTAENEEKEVITTNFIDDSMIDEREEYEEYDIELDTDYHDRPTIKMNRSEEESFEEGQKLEKYMMADRSHRQSVTSSQMHRSTYEHVIGGVKTPILDQTPRRPSTTGRSSIPSLDMDRLDHPTKVAGFMTSTPQIHKMKNTIDVFGQEESPRDSPRLRRDRRGTQTIVPPSFDSPASDRKFKSPMPPPPPAPANSHVKSIVSEFAKADFGFHRKINAAEEIAELKRREESVKSASFDENQNLVVNGSEADESQESVPRISHHEMRPTIQMGVSGYKLRNRDYSQHSEDVLYSLPVKKSTNKPTTSDYSQAEETDERAARASPRIVSKTVRQSLPFSDIPEERTCDKIDEMFDFAPSTADFDEKTLEERLDEGFVVENGGKTVGGQQRMDLSTNTYQEIEFNKDTTPFVENMDDDENGTEFSGGSSGGGPQFTRSPTQVTPHAGRSVTEYRVSEREGHARTEKVVVQKMIQPSALATSTPKGTFAWRRNQTTTGGPEDSSFVSSISNFSAVDKLNDSRRQISKLIETIEKTRKHIQLAEISLMESKRARIVVQELASQRVLLICRERLKLQLDEVRRLQALSAVRHAPPPINRQFKSAMDISNIAVHLNKNFTCRGSFAFIVALKCRTEIEATGVVTLLAHYQTRTHVIHFGEYIHFSKLPFDFVITMEVYMMRVPEYKAPEKTCASVLAAKFRNFLVPNSAHRRPRGNSVSANRTVVSLPGYEAPECDFKFCGKLVLDRDSLGDRQFYLDDVSYPLEGTVKLVSYWSSLPAAIDVEHRDYLYLLDERAANGEASWDKYWAMLQRGIIFFWKNEADERNDQIPLSQIDLTKCTNQSVEEVRNERKHEFHIEMLIDQTPSLLEKRRVVLAAESSDDLASWLNAINDTLCKLRS